MSHFRSENMGWLIDLAEAAMPEPMLEAGAKRETLDPDALWWRVAITEPNGRTLDLDPLGLVLPRLASVRGALPRLGAP